MRRIIEIGASSILTNMSKKTNSSKFQTLNLARSLDRSFLSISKNKAEIGYHYEAAPAPVTAPATTEAAAEVKQAPQEVNSQPAPKTEKQTRTAAAVADVPTAPLESARAIVAARLKKPLDKISPEKSLKELSSGRLNIPHATFQLLITLLGKSTLQNEWVGDLAAEFGALPDRAEDMSLATLCEDPACKSYKDIGKPISMMIERWSSSTMPGGFGVSAMREHIQKRWGMGPGRQNSVIIVAMVKSKSESSPKLESVDTAKAYLDAAATEYAASCGLSLDQASVGGEAEAGGAVTMSAEDQKSIMEGITRLASTQHAALSKYLGEDNEADVINAELRVVQKKLEAELSGWMSEFGYEFQEGIKPMLDELTIRHYNFSWHQARVDIVRLLLNESEATANFTERELLQLVDRSDERCLQLAERMLYHHISSLEMDDAVLTLGQHMVDVMKKRIHLPPVARFTEQATRPSVQFTEDGSAACVHLPRKFDGRQVSYPESLTLWGKNSEHVDMPVCLKSQDKGTWHHDADMTAHLLSSIQSMIQDGLTFESKVVLITGAGSGSIGAEIVKKLLMGGATVVVTTSRDATRAQKFYRDIYKNTAARGAELYVVPFNQASVVDCQKLVQYVYRTLGKSIDVFLPLAAMPEQGIELDQLGERSELAHRLMMTNVLRLIGLIVQEKTAQNISCQLTQVLMPLSPNHGIFGGDGLYSESKLGLEGVLNRVSSESWGDKISVCGVLIGWTRGTGLMAGNDIVAEAVEEHGALTFTTEEMALNILALLTNEVSPFWEDDSLLADFSGCLGQIEDLKGITTQARSAIRIESETRIAIQNEDRIQHTMTNALPPQSQPKVDQLRHQQSIRMELPKLPVPSCDLFPLAYLQGMADLESTVVIVGFSEIGPWGSSRTRWQMEAFQQLSASGYVEMAWLMGLIKRSNATSPDEIGWVDAKAGDKLSYEQIQERFGKYIMDNSGIRLIDPDTSGYDPANKEILQEVAIQDDLPEFETDSATAESFRRKHGKDVLVTQISGQDRYKVKVKAGARIFVPKAARFSRSMVAGLLPKGWSPSRLGIPDDIIDQVDPVTLYALYCTAEAFLSAGIEDATEVFEHMHVSEVGNFIGSSLGGLQKNQDMFRNTYLDKQVQSDVLQETNPNTPAAWVNMVLLGASGPIKTPVGACATALESLDGALDSITAGKTKMCLVGGVDAFHEDESFAFGAMGATADSGKDFARGRQPKEMSRPMSESRSGFVEAEGGGVQIICTAQVAIEMGLPVYAIVAGTTMASDKIGRSVPAPGQGLLTFAKETPGAELSPYLDVSFRRREMERAIANLTGSNISFSGGTLTPDSSVSSPSSVASGPPPGDEALRLSVAAIRRQWTRDFRQMDPRISPMRAALAAWGLTVDDIGIVSLHGTSTKANDLNETKTLQQQLTHLGRKGPPLISMCQKSVTGHPKGPAASWMLNGCLQVLQTGLVPGNVACDNVDPALAVNDHLIFPSETMEVGPVKAFLLDSFGFGQKGAQMVGVAPKYLFAALRKEEYFLYVDRYTARKRLANRNFVKAVFTNSIVRPHDHAAYEPELTSRVLLDPMARATATNEGKLEKGYPRYQFSETRPRTKKHKLH